MPHCILKCGRLKMKKTKIFKTRLHTGCGLCRQDFTVHTALHSLPKPTAQQSWSHHILINKLSLFFLMHTLILSIIINYHTN